MSRTRREGVATLPLQSEQELLAANGVKRTPPLLLTYRTEETLASHSLKRWRRGAGSNRRIKVLQTSALPLGYRAGGALLFAP
jgi:hypothetical protein